MNKTYVTNICNILNRRMSTEINNVLTPVGVRGMKSLDRDKFLRNVSVPVLEVPEDIISNIIPSCKKYLLKLENFKPVQNYEEKSRNERKKWVHFNPEKHFKWTSILEADRSLFNKHGITEDNFVIKDIQLSYDNWRVEQIFKAVLPENEEIVSGFSQIGHIVHLNLRDHLLDYKPLIGQVLLDKIKTCRTVVNKCNIIASRYRNFSMEVLAGEEDFKVCVKENRCIFEFDFSKVYWNPRLGKEHERILLLLKPGDILFDVFCGVGPFSIPAAKRKCIVYANDLNPDSFTWLNHNAKVNKIDSKFFQSFNDDGVNFIQNNIKDYLIELNKGVKQISNDAKIHITMNLPAMAVEFLKYFNGLLKAEDENCFDYDITVHVYCFALGDNITSVAKDMVVEHLGVDITSDVVEVVDVRNVSPKKQMVRVSFKLTSEVLFSKCSTNSEVVSEPPVKKLCI